MKKFILLFTALAATAVLFAQNHEITFNVEKQPDVLYLGQHFRDDFTIIDSARNDGNNSYKFNVNQKLERGIYAIIKYGTGKDRDKKLKVLDITIDGDRKFTITSDASLAASKMKVKGSESNKLMFEYIAKNDEARAKAREIQGRMKSTDEKEQEKAKAEMEELSNTMIAYEKEQMEKNKQYRFFQLLSIFSGPDVPDEIPDEQKGAYYREHYWDGVDLTDHSLTRTPDLFNKMNYYFFGVLYYAEADTICKYADMLIDKVVDDAEMMKYIMDFIMPKYFRSTKNVGWDATWCHLVRRYYQPNRSGFALPGDVTYKVGEATRLEKSLIGAPGVELLMADSVQRPGTESWISSHCFPQKYVVLWFWDPDCHHCQEQTATLITLYDSLTANGTRNFEVFAVGFESDVPKWKRYVQSHRLPFVNVGGPNVNVDYQQEYNVHGAPTMIILNADRRIIMNKTLPTNSIVPFLTQYEKDHPEEANREPSYWQIQGQRIWGNAYDPAKYFNLTKQQIEERGVKSVKKVKGIQ